jgi:hypothetical protein
MLTLNLKLEFYLKTHIHLQLKFCLTFLHGVRSNSPKADIVIIQVLKEFRVLSLWRFRPQSAIEIRGAIAPLRLICA